MPGPFYGGGPDSGYDLAAFRARFPEFTSISDALVGGQLDESLTWLDKTRWTDRDYPLGVLYWTAHILQIRQRQLGTGSGSGSSKFTGSSDLFVQSSAFGERKFTFAQRAGVDKAMANAAPGEALLETTLYGSLFVQLRNRNIIAVMVV
jgi:hypothetical protein